MTRRLCLIGLPRCGSQYITELIIRNIKNITNLTEPFTPGHFTYNISLSDENNIIPCNDSSSLKIAHNEQINHVINVIKNGNPNQSLILKLFLTSQYSLETYKKILTILKEANFQFLIIKRLDKLNHILSNLIGDELQFWSNYSPASDNRIVEIKDILKIKDTCKLIYEFDLYLKNLELDKNPVIHYENVKHDLENIFKKTILLNTNIRKMSDLLSSDRITNIKEVKDIIEQEIKMYA